MTAGPARPEGTNEARSGALAAEALARWGLPGSFRIERAPAGTMNEVFVVADTEPRFVLRGHRHQERWRVAFEHQTMRVAVGSGIPVPVAVAAPGGDSFIRQGQRWWSLLAWRSGQPVPRGHHSAAQAHSMGQILGRIHITLGGVEAPVAPSDQREPLVVTTRRADEIIGIVAGIECPGQEDAWALAWLQGQREWLAVQEDSDPGVAGDIQVVHGDYHSANIVFAGREVSGVLDWDKAGAGSPGEEVVRAIHLSFDLGPGPSAAFLAGYRTECQLPGVELDRAAARYARGRDRSIWLFDELYRLGNERVRSLVNPKSFRPFEQAWAELSQALG
jgi:Ser/Thr protein kinase RdoA (MazF antagonist)